MLLERGNLSQRSGWASWALVVLLSCFAINLSAEDQTTPAGANPTAAQPADKTGDEAGTKAVPPAAGTSSANDSSLRLGAGDLIEVNVYNVPELTSKARVGNNGDVYLPLIDYVHVAGLTADEAQEIVEKKLADGGFVKNPHVTIFVDQYATQGVSVLGEIARPGVYPVLGQLRLFDLISTAGGLTEKSGRTATITRRNPAVKPVIVPLSKNLEDSPQSNVEVLPGDTVIFRMADIVYVVGDVGHPTGLLIDRGSITVLQALALAGGTTRTSRPNGAKLLHKTPSGMTESPVQLKRILQAKAPDMPMKPDDILVIPTSRMKTVLQDNASLAYQAASLSLVIVR